MKLTRFFFRQYYRYIIVCTVSVVFCVMGAAGYFKNLDAALYDCIVQLKKNPAPRKELLLINLDKESLLASGVNKNTPEIMSDALLRMKELGAASAVFDVDFSTFFDTDSDSSQIRMEFQKKKQTISNGLLQLSSDVKSGNLSSAEFSDALENLSFSINSSMDDLYTMLCSGISRSDMTLFAPSLEFMGSSWIAVSTAPHSPNVQDSEAAHSFPRLYVKNMQEEKKGSGKGTAISLSITPAVRQLLSYADGAGVVTTLSDEDGVTRRISLVTRCSDGSYAPDLIFAPILENLSVQRVTYRAHALVLEGARLPGAAERGNIIIPLDSDRKMLVNWVQEGQPQSFRRQSFLSLVQLSACENEIVAALQRLNNLVVRAQDGSPLSYSDSVASLLTDYSAIQEQQQNLLDRCKGYDKNGVSVGGGVHQSDYEHYFALRTSFFEAVRQFAGDSYEDEIKNRLEEMRLDLGEESYAAILSDVSGLFENISHDAVLYQQVFGAMKKEYKDSVCIIGTADKTVDVYANAYNTVANKDFLLPVTSWYVTFIFFALLIFSVFLLRHCSFLAQSLSAVVMLFICVSVPPVLMVVMNVYVPFAIPLAIAAVSLLLSIFCYFLFIRGVSVKYKKKLGK